MHLRAEAGAGKLQSSLRDLLGLLPIPGAEAPGYFRTSIRGWIPLVLGSILKKSSSSADSYADGYISENVYFSFLFKDASWLFLPSNVASWLQSTKCFKAHWGSDERLHAIDKAHRLVTEKAIINPV